jgi:hypothetical protein
MAIVVVTRLSSTARQHKITESIKNTSVEMLSECSIVIFFNYDFIPAYSATGLLKA